MTLKSYSLNPGAKSTEPLTLEGRLANLSDDELLSLRRLIDVRLKVEIANINLTEELGLQYREGLLLLNSIREDRGTPVNQKAQALNTVRTALVEIIKQQHLVYSAERLKRFEVAFHKILEKLPEDSRKHYFEMYGDFLNDKGV